MSYACTGNSSLSSHRRNAGWMVAVTVCLTWALLMSAERAALAQTCTINGCTVSNGPFGNLELLNCRTRTAGGPFVFMCRGWLSTSNYFFAAKAGGTMSPFTPNSSAAGPTGANLAPGTCAFEDRTLRATEPHILFKAYTSTVSGDTLSSPVDGATNILTQCANNESCVFAVCVINQKVDGLEVMDASTSVGGGDADILTIYNKFD